MKKRLILFFALITISVSSQNSKQDLYNIGVITNTPIKSLIESKYKKKIYVGENEIYSVAEKNSRTEIIKYNIDKSFSKFFLLKDKKLFEVLDYEYTDTNLSDLSKEQQDKLKEYYTVLKDSTKNIKGLECFKVIMKAPGGLPNNNITMFVTDDIPNLPDHFPMASNVLNCQPIEITLNIMGQQILIGIVDSKKDSSIENDYKIDFKNSKKISKQEYLNIR